MVRHAFLFVFCVTWVGCLSGPGGLSVSSEDATVDPVRITRVLADLDTARTPGGRLEVAGRLFQEARLMALSGVRGREAYRAAYLAGRTSVLREEVLVVGASLRNREATAVLAEVARVTSARSRRRIVPGRTVLFALWEGTSGRNQLRHHPLVSSSAVVGEIVISGMDDGSARGLERAAAVYLDSLEAASFAPDSLPERPVP